MSRSLVLTTVFGFFFGLTNVGIYNGAYVNVCEYVHTFWKNHVCTFLLVFDQLTVVFIALYWKYISKDWVWFQVFGLIILCLATVGFYFLPESPEYLYSFYRFEECREVIARIAKWNKKDKVLPEVYQFDVENELLKIKFDKQIADKEENFRTSIYKEKEHRKKIQVQQSMKAGIREFVNHEDPLVRNLSILMVLWFITVINYQINDYYDD